MNTILEKIDETHLDIIRLEKLITLKQSGMDTGYTMDQLIRLLQESQAKLRDLESELDSADNNPEK